MLLFSTFSQFLNVWPLVTPSASLNFLTFGVKIRRWIAKATDAFRKSHSLVRFMGWWHHWTVLDLHDMWFQQDGATCHTARIIMDLLRGKSGEHFISRSGPVHWPPRWWDLTPLDYFCGAMLKLMSIQIRPLQLTWVTGRNVGKSVPKWD